MLRAIKTIFLITLPFFLFPQTKEELKKQKEKIQKEISYTKELLEKTTKNKKKSINYIKVLSTQIKNQTEFISAISLEMKLFNTAIRNKEKEITNTEKIIEEEEENLKLLRKEYEKMIYYSYIKKGDRNNLVFVFSSKNFNQAYKRILYLKQYSFFRKNQVKKITTSNRNLKLNKEKLERQKKQLIAEFNLKKSLVKKKNKELNSINNLKNEKEALTAKLSNSEIKFKEKLLQKQKKHEELEDKIKKIIEEEIKKYRKNNKNNYILTPEAMLLSEKFFENKGKLPWPLEQGVIVEHYGKQKHSVFSEVETFNNGIDIATNNNTPVRAVFDGIISRIFFIKGEGKAILINHGEYYSVYSGLKEVFVKINQKVFLKEKIGVVLTQESENKTELHFEIWKGYEKQNPSSWLFDAD